MPIGWRHCSLGDVLTFQRGFDLPERYRREGNIPIVSSSGITGYHNVSKVSGPGVVTGRYGTLGEVFYIKEDFWPLNTTLYVRDFKGNDPLFLSYFLRTLNLAHQNVAGAVPGLNRNALHLLSANIPPLPTQRKIAAILSAYDDLIENNTRRINILEEMAQSLYREWFVHFRFPGHEKKRMVESELGLIPEGWEVKVFSDATELIRNGIDPSKFENETFEHYSIPAFDEGCMPTMNTGSDIKSNKFSVPEDSVLLSKLNPRIPRVWLPMITGSRRAVASTEFLVLIPRPPYSREFLYCCCQSREFIDRFKGKAGGTSTSHQRVKPEDLRSLRVVQPEKAFLKTFTETIAPMFQSIHSLRLRNANLRCTRDLLLPKLISGEIDVEELEIEIGKKLSTVVESLEHARVEEVVLAGEQGTLWG